MSKSPSIIGIDASLRSTGWYAGAERYGLIQTTTREIAPLVTIRDSLARVLDKVQPDAAVIESNFFGVNLKTTQALSEVAGIMKELLQERNVVIITATAPQTRKSLREYLQLDAVVDKRRVFDEFCERHLGEWNFTKGGSDIADSWALYVHGFLNHVKKGKCNATII